MPTTHGTSFHGLSVVSVLTLITTNILVSITAGRMEGIKGSAMEGEAQQREGDVEPLSVASVYFNTKINNSLKFHLK
jgi:hypothetical protein